MDRLVPAKRLPADSSNSRPGVGPQLLTNQEMNLGARQVIPAPNFTAAPAPGMPQRLLQLIADGCYAETVTLTVGQNITQPGVVTTNLSGPITCIAVVGNGSGG